MFDVSALAEDFATIYRHLDYAVPPGGLRIEVVDARDAGGSWTRMSVFAGLPALPPDDTYADLYRAIERIVRAGVIDSIWCVEGVVVLDARIDTTTHHPPGDQPCPAHSTI